MKKSTKTTPRKLVLHREAIVVLDPRRLGAAAGGSWWPCRPPTQQETFVPGEDHQR